MVFNNLCSVATISQQHKLLVIIVQSNVTKSTVTFTVVGQASDNKLTEYQFNITVDTSTTANSRKNSNNATNSTSHHGSNNSTSDDDNNDSNDNANDNNDDDMGDKDADDDHVAYIDVEEDQHDGELRKQDGGTAQKILLFCQCFCIWKFCLRFVLFHQTRMSMMRHNRNETVS